MELTQKVGNMEAHHSSAGRNPARKKVFITQNKTKIDPDKIARFPPQTPLKYCCRGVEMTAV
jgi:hypothetical protein